MTMYKKYRDKEYIKRLVQRCIDRDLYAWDEFVTLVTRLITYIIKGKFSRLRFNYNNSDVENLRQDILLNIWEKNKLGTIRDKNNAITWLGVFSANAASNYVRDLKPVDPPNAFSLDDSQKSLYPLPSEGLSNKETRNDIERALRSLNPKENIIIKLALLYGKKYKEIAQILNIPIGTVLVSAKRAKAKLRKNLKNHVIK